MRAQRRHALGARVDVDDRVALPGLRARQVGVAAPQIDDGLAVDDDRDGCADLVRSRRLAAKASRTAREAGMTLAMDRRRDRTWEAGIRPRARSCPPRRVVIPGRVIAARAGTFGVDRCARAAVRRRSSRGARARSPARASVRLVAIPPPAARGGGAPGGRPVAVAGLPDGADRRSRCEWPFHLQLAEGIETYPPAEWTSASAAYVLGLAVLPIFWLSAALGFGLIVLLDGVRPGARQRHRCRSVRWIRGRPHPPA